MGAFVFLLIGLKVTGWATRRIALMCETKRIDITLVKFVGSGVKRGEQFERLNLYDRYYSIVLKCIVKLRKAPVTL